MVQHVDSDSDYDDASDGSSDEEYAEGDRRLRKKRPYVPKPGVEVFIVSYLQSKPFHSCSVHAVGACLDCNLPNPVCTVILRISGWPDALNEAGHAAGPVQCLWRHH
jgi:hypothetical protein